MTKIISLSKRVSTSIKKQEKDDVQKLINWTKDMSELLLLIETSLHNTPKNESENINSRG